jgi:hypothetical protein
MSRLEFLKECIEAFDKANIRHAVLRNQEEILAGTEKDVDMIAEVSSYNKLSQVFKCVCHKYGYIPKVKYKGKSLFLSTFQNVCIYEEKRLDRGIILHFVPFISVKNTFLKLKIPGHATRIMCREIDFELITKKNVSFRMPSAKWRLLFLLEKIQHKPKKVYLSEINELISGDFSHQSDKAKLIEIIKNATKKTASTKCRLKAVNKTLRVVYKSSSKVKSFLEFTRLVLLNASDKFKKSGLIIIFSGPDGAGKSTTKDHLVNFMTNELGMSIISIKGMNPLNNPKSLGSTITKTQHKIRGVSNASAASLENELRDRKPSKNKLSWKVRRNIGLLFILIQYPFSYFMARIRTYRGKTTIVDTSVFDRFIKAHRPRNKFLEKITVPFLPAGDILFRLYSDPKVIVMRKPELTIKELTEYYHVMDDIFSIKKKSNIYIIKTHQEPNVAACNVKSEVIKILGHCSI